MSNNSIKSIYGLPTKISAALIKSKKTKGFFNKTISYKTDFTLGDEFCKKLVYCNSPKVNTDILNSPLQDNATELFTDVGSKELFSLLDHHPFAAQTGFDFDEQTKTLAFTQQQLKSLESSLLLDLKQSEKFRGYGTLRTKIKLNLTISEFSKFYIANLSVSLAYQFFLVIDPYEKIKIDLTKNVENYPDLERNQTNELTLKFEKR